MENAEILSSTLYADRPQGMDFRELGQKRPSFFDNAKRVGIQFVGGVGIAMIVGGGAYFFVLPAGAQERVVSILTHSTPAEYSSEGLAAKITDEQRVIDKMSSYCSSSAPRWYADQDEPTRKLWAKYFASLQEHPYTDGIFSTAKDSEEARVLDKISEYSSARGLFPKRDEETCKLWSKYHKEMPEHGYTDTGIFTNSEQAITEAQNGERKLQETVAKVKAKAETAAPPVKPLQVDGAE